jgi:murein DD-endopeptidase MepM/ murein hydrolase activator NlpD
VIAARWFAACLAAALASAAAASDDCQRGVCIHETRSDDAIRIRASNENPAPVYLRVEFTDLENLASTPARPELVVGAEASADVATLRPARSDRGTRYAFTWRHQLGDPAAVPDAAARYRIPFGGDAPRRVVQGPDGPFSHRGEIAYDFAMPIGTPVLAAREGRVAQVVDEYRKGGERSELRDKANFVSILHADGTFGRYIHLREGAVVKPGQRVAAGALVGYSGNTGFSAQSHLHFDVVRATRDGGLESLPIRFASDDPAGFVPAVGTNVLPQGQSSRLQPGASK